MHHSDPLSVVRHQPADERQQYKSELDRLAAENAALREERRKMSLDERLKTDVTAAFNKAGGGAPIRAADNKLVTKTGLVR